MELRLGAARRRLSLAYSPPLTGADYLHTPKFWTGLEPQQSPGFDAERNCLASLKAPDLRERGTKLRSSLEDYFENGWALTEVLFSSLRGPEAYYRPPAHGLRHPLVFYYGHPAALAVNKLRVAGALTKGLCDDFDVLFETGVDEMSWDDLDTPSTRWPELQEVREYRSKARDLVLNVIRNHPALDEPISPKEATDSKFVVWSLGMICEHERIHLETSTTLMRELPLEDVSRPSYWPPDHPSVAQTSTSPPMEFVSVNGGSIELGKPRTHSTYSWDNEYGSRVIEARPFKASRTQVTNGQFLDFVKSGGYASPDHWSEDGWAWRSFRNTKWPHFWERTGPQGVHEYALRLPFDEVPLPLDLPAEVNKHEAHAYCKWLSNETNQQLRLPTECEYHLMLEANNGCTLAKARENEAVDDVATMGAKELASTSLNANLAWGSPSSVHDGQAPFSGLRGNSWEYCEDWFAALPGYATHPLYEDFSTPCFDGQHALILGGSFASTGNEASVFSRFHFRPHFHNLLSFRVVAGEEHPELSSHDAAKPWAAGWVPPQYKKLSEEGSHKYESAAQLAAYLDLHYGGSGALDGPASSLSSLSLQDALDFPQRCAAKLGSGRRALDVGCAVGGSCKALASSFEEVVGIDYAQGFIDAANALKTNDLNYARSGEASLPGAQCLAHAFTPSEAEKLTFMKGDACDLPESLGTFDAVLAANLLCRLREPQAFIDRLPSLVNDGGRVFFASPFSWMPEYTPPEKWLSPQQLEQRMRANGFVLEAAAPEAVVIRDHARKFQFVVSHGMLFRKS